MGQNQSGASRTDTLVKFILVFFISLLSFSVGTFVGKQFSDSQHRMAALQNEFNEDAPLVRATASLPPNQMNIEPENVLTDDDIAKLAEDFVSQEEPEVTVDVTDGKVAESDIEEEPAMDDQANAEEPLPKVLPDNPTVSVNEETAQIQVQAPLVMRQPQAEKQNFPNGVLAPDHMNKVVENVVAGKNPAPIKEENKKAIRLPSAVTATTIGKYTVQIASHPAEGDAKTHTIKLKKKGYSAFYVPAQVKGSTWYRVNVGLFPNKKDAKAFAKSLSKNNLFKGALVQKITN